MAYFATIRCGRLLRRDAIAAIDEVIHDPTAYAVQPPSDEDEYDEEGEEEEEEGEAQAHAARRCAVNVSWRAGSVTSWNTLPQGDLEVREDMQSTR